MKKKFGFTLAEALIFMAIVGILIVVAFSTFKNFDKGIRYIYSNTYHALDRALFNSTNFSERPDPFELIDSNGTAVSPDEGRRRLCQALLEYINTLESHCETASIDASGNAFNDPQRVPDIVPHFVAGNGIRFYISSRLIGLGENDPVFYIIFADINGIKRPNSMNYVRGVDAQNIKTVDPDIFAFAALDIGRVCPLGIPEFDPRYMMTRISYEETVQNQAGGQEAVRRYTRNSKPYYISKAEAWGYYLAENSLPENTIIEDEPYSYNGYIRSIIPNSAIYSFMNSAPFNGRPLTAPQGVSYLNTNGVRRCEPVTDDTDVSCEVFIDRYIY